MDCNDLYVCSLKVYTNLKKRAFPKHNVNIDIHKNTKNHSALNINPVNDVRILIIVKLVNYLEFI